MNKIREKIKSLGLQPIHKMGKYQKKYFAIVECPTCRKKRELPFEKIIYKKVFTGLCLPCERRTKMGKNHPRWKGGERYCQNGYIYKRVYEDDIYYPMADKDGRMKRARYVMANYLGRCLDRKEHVHHKNKNRTDDRISNLELVDYREHLRQHYAERKIDKNGRFLPANI